MKTEKIRLGEAIRLLNRTKEKIKTKEKEKDELETVYYRYFGKVKNIKMKTILTRIGSEIFKLQVIEARLNDTARAVYGEKIDIDVTLKEDIKYVKLY